MTSRVFVQADWSQMETWLNTYFSGDTVMRRELDNNLAGGHKIHALNAGLIYDIDPADAKTHMVELQGQQKPAYDGGKRSGHAFNYGMKARMFAKQFWTTREFAEKALGGLEDKYAATVAYREGLADQVFGRQVYACPTCGWESLYTTQRCPTCSRPGQAHMTKWNREEQHGEHVLYTPFGRRRIYLGRRGEGSNAVASQLPQSCGASIWYRTLLRLGGYDVYASDTRWPVAGRTPLVWSPRLETYGQLYAPFETFVATGTYDSFLVEAYEDEAEDVLKWVLWTMEQPWPELGGLRLPAEGSIGHNWRKHGKDNTDGQRERADIRPFSVRRSDLRL